MKHIAFCIVIMMIWTGAVLAEEQSLPDGAAPPPEIISPEEQPASTEGAATGTLPTPAEAAPSEETEAPAESAPPAESPAPASPAEPQPAAWDGEAEVGMISTSGNSDTQSINTRLRGEREQARWRHGGNANYYSASDRDATTARRFIAGAKSDYAITTGSYLFVTARYEDDRFAGYEWRITESTGYGHRSRLGDWVRIEAEVGGGGRHTRFEDGSRRNEGIVRLAAKLKLRLGETGEFREEAFTEIASNNTHSESMTSLKAKINTRFAMKTSFTAIHNTRVPVNVKKTDTITSVTLAYDF